MLTSEWPTPEQPHTVPYVVRQFSFLRRAGVEVEVFPFRGAKRVTNYVRAWVRLRRAVDLRSFDLVHAQFGQSALLALPKRRPLVVTFRGSDILGILGPDGRTTRYGRILRRLCQLVARIADEVIIVSEGQRAFVPASVQPHVLPSGLDLASVPTLSPDVARRELGLDPDARHVLFVGPATYGKGHDVAERSVELLRARMAVNLVLGVGLQQAEILLLMRACDALLFTSRQEGSPNVVKEALACDLPIVSTPVGDVRERLAGVDGCEVVSDWDPEVIAAALERVLSRGGRIEGKKAVKELDETAITERLLEIYRSAVGHA